MKRQQPLVIVIATLLVACNLGADTTGVNQQEAEVPQEKKTAVLWQHWSSALFEKAKNENRLVLVDFAAEWCHFCKKMDQTTWRDAEVLTAIKSGYISVRVQDEIDTDPADKYRRYGRPECGSMANNGLCFEPSISFRGRCARREGNLCDPLVI